jgi:apolipoprotein D and lipocalin family protein
MQGMRSNRTILNHGVLRTWSLARRFARFGRLLVPSLLLTACAAMPQDPIAPVAHVDLARFMGPWFVIASIPTFLEKNAYDAVESYESNPDGTIATTFTFRKGGFDGPTKTMKPHGFVLDKTSNARWGMQFLWPIKAQYLIAYLDDAYTETIIARDRRDYVWIMARAPSLSPADYERLRARVGAMGYDTSKLRLVPQQHP